MNNRRSKKNYIQALIANGTKNLMNLFEQVVNLR